MHAQGNINCMELLIEINWRYIVMARTKILVLNGFSVLLNTMSEKIINDGVDKKISG